MTSSTSEALPLLRSTFSSRRSEDGGIQTVHPRIFDNAKRFSKFSSSKTRLLKGAVIIASVGVLIWICLSSSISYHIINSDVAQWNDVRYHQWESFLNDHLEGAIAGVSVEFKSHSKIDAHEKYKQAKKESNMKHKQVKKQSYPNPKSGLLYLNNTRAIGFLRHGTYDTAADFFMYQQGWEVQINQAYCAIATSAAVLNSFRGPIALPQDPIYEPFPWATQMTLVEDECVKAAVFDIDSVKRAGLGIGMVPNLLNCFLVPEGFNAMAYPVDPEFSSQDQLKDVVVNALLDKNSRVVLNYDRGGIGQGPMGHGHWSPIGAYSSEIDSFLIMDVAKYKYPPVWVSTDKLFGGVGTLDVCSAMKEHNLPVDWGQDFETIGQELGCTPGYRGFVVISPIDGGS